MNKNKLQLKYHDMELYHKLDQINISKFGTQPF